MSSDIKHSSFLRSEKTVIFIVALLLFFLLSLRSFVPFESSPFPYYQYLAKAFASGQLYLLEEPTKKLDLIFFEGKYFLYWPPMPAVVHAALDMLLPFSFSDIIANQLCGALIGVLAICLLDLFSQHVVPLSKKHISLLSIFFIFGTSLLPIMPYGTVWSTSQLYGIAFTLLAYISILKWKGDRGAVLCAFFIGCATLCRLTLIVNILWPCWYVASRSNTTTERLRKGALVFFTLCVFVSLYGLYNWARFGSAFEMGYKYHLMNDMFKSDYAIYGGFSTHYILKNLYYHFVHYPFPTTNDTAMGGSFFLLSPFYFYLFRAFKAKKNYWDVLILFLSCIISYVPIVLIMGTGWVQFGTRYLLDFCVPILCLLAFAIADLKTLRLAWCLVIISIIHFLIGALVIAPAFQEISH